MKKYYIDYPRNFSNEFTIYSFRPEDACALEELKKSLGEAGRTGEKIDNKAKIDYHSGNRQARNKQPKENGKMGKGKSVKIKLELNYGDSQIKWSVCDGDEKGTISNPDWQDDLHFWRPKEEIGQAYDSLEEVIDTLRCDTRDGIIESLWNVRELEQPHLEGWTVDENSLEDVLDTICESYENKLERWWNAEEEEEEEED